MIQSISKCPLLNRISYPWSLPLQTISSIISIILARNIETYDKTKYKYIITPKFEDETIVKIKLNYKIDIKIVHIINVIYMLIKKRSVKYDERASNRRTYASLNE